MDKDEKNPNGDYGTNLIIIRVMEAADKTPCFEMYSGGEKIEKLNPAILKEINDLKIVFSISDASNGLNDRNLRESFRVALEQELDVRFNDTIKIADDQIIVYNGIEFKGATAEIWIRYFRPGKTFGDLSYALMQHNRENLRKFKKVLKK